MILFEKANDLSDDSRVMIPISLLKNGLKHDLNISVSLQKGQKVVHDSNLTRDSSFHYLRYLMGQNVSIDLASESDGVTPLIAACFYGQIDVVEYLLGEGADFSLRMTTLGSTALVVAAQQGLAITRPLFWI